METYSEPQNIYPNLGNLYYNHPLFKDQQQQQEQNAFPLHVPPADLFETNKWNKSDAVEFCNLLNELFQSNVFEMSSEPQNQPQKSNVVIEEIHDDQEQNQQEKNQNQEIHKQNEIKELKLAKQYKKELKVLKEENRLVNQLQLYQLLSGTSTRTQTIVNNNVTHVYNSGKEEEEKDKKEKKDSNNFNTVTALAAVGVVGGVVLPAVWTISKEYQLLDVVNKLDQLYEQFNLVKPNQNELQFDRIFEFYTLLDIWKDIREGIRLQLVNKMKNVGIGTFGGLFLGLGVVFSAPLVVVGGGLTLVGMGAKWILNRNQKSFKSILEKRTTIYLKANDWKSNYQY